MARLTRIWCLLLLATLLTLQSRSQAAGGDHAEPSHGTVNVILASGDTLVAVTDSMITFSKTDHRPIGIKLFKLDERTICTIAGLYSDPGPFGLDTLTLYMPEIMAEISQGENRIGGAQTPFSQRVDFIASVFRFQLTSHLQAMVAEKPQSDIAFPSFLVELTVAGYDTDESLKVAEITLAPYETSRVVSFTSVVRPRGLAVPNCALASDAQTIKSRFDRDVTYTVYRVPSALFCDIAGKPRIAYELLDKPNLIPQDTVLQMYSLAEQTNRTLSPSELRSLAIELEKQTAANDKELEVGGTPQVAILSGGQIIEGPPTISPTTSGSGLLGPHIQGGIRCNGVGPGVDDAYPFRTQYSVSMFECNQKIDKLIFHNSTFTDSSLIYMGAQPLTFADSNVIVRSTLELGPNVDLQRQDVIHLVCGFPWKAVYQNSRQVNLECPAPPSK